MTGLLDSAGFTISLVACLRGQPYVKRDRLNGKGVTMSDLNQSEVLTSGLSDNAAGGIAYITLIPAVVFLIIDPYRKSSFVRFHCWQSIFFFITWALVNIVVGALQSLAPAIIFQTLSPWQMIGLLFFVIWLILFINAFNGKRVKLPIVGDLAEKQANR